MGVTRCSNSQCSPTCWRRHKARFAWGAARGWELDCLCQGPEGRGVARCARRPGDCAGHGSRGFVAEERAGSVAELPGAAPSLPGSRVQDGNLSPSRWVEGQREGKREARHAPRVPAQVAVCESPLRIGQGPSLLGLLRCRGGSRGRVRDNVESAAMKRGRGASTRDKIKAEIALISRWLSKPRKVVDF